MMRLPGAVRRFLSHTRYVATPVYRLMVVAWLISAVLQLSTGKANVSIRDGGPGGAWDWIVLGFQIAGPVTCLVGLYLVAENSHHASKLSRSLTLELIGIIELEMVIAWQIAGATINQGTIPTAGTSWMGIIFGVWMLFRMRAILRAQRELGRT